VSVASLGLGRGHAALYATDEPLAGALRSDVADLRHVPLESPGGGSITAALFLREFVGDVPWAHLDIAEQARATADRHEVTAGATGYGARLLLAAVDRL